MYGRTCFAHLGCWIFILWRILHADETHFKFQPSCCVNFQRVLIGTFAFNQRIARCWTIYECFLMHLRSQFRLYWHYNVAFFFNFYADVVDFRDASPDTTYCTIWTGTICEHSWELPHFPAEWRLDCLLVQLLLSWISILHYYFH